MMAASLVPHRQLTEWLVEHDGYLHPHVEIKHKAEKGFHVVVAEGKAVKAMTRIASCPIPATLSVLNAMDVAPFGCQGTRFPPVFVRRDHNIVQNFFLVEQYVQGMKSWWAPYISTLPTPTEVKQQAFPDEQDLLWLEGTNLKLALSTQDEKWRAMYEDGLEQLKKLRWHNALNGSYTWELFRWAATIFASRSFTSQVLADTLPADRARPIGRHEGHRQHQDITKLFSDGFPVLLPLLDLLNYKPRARVEWQARYSFVGLQVMDDFESGQELCNNYGPRDNETLMLGYGFLIENNPFDHFSVALKIPPGSPLEASRTWTSDPKSDENRRCYVFTAEHPRAYSTSCLEFSLFSYDLLDSISVLTSNDRELQKMSMTQQTLISDGLRNGFEDYRNVLNTIAQLLQECQVREAALFKSRPSGRVPQSPSQHYANTYRNSQLLILQTAVLVCKLILGRARHTNSDEEVFNAVTRNSPHEVAVANLQTLMQRHKCMTRPGELVDVKSLRALLKTTDGLEAVIQQLGDRLSSQVSHRGPSGAVDVARSQYAVILGALQIRFERGEALPQRLRLWIDQLTQWYPPEDPNWSYVPHEGPYEAGEDPPPALVTLLQESRAMLANWPTSDDRAVGVPPVNSSIPPEPVNLLQTQQLLNGTPASARHWLKPERLCWGWNVMEEEGVRAPDGDAGASLLLLYCSRA